MAPVRHNGYWLVDGAVVNPVPISLTRALGADIVIAVDLQHDAHLMQQDLLSVNLQPDLQSVEGNLRSLVRSLAQAGGAEVIAHGNRDADGDGDYVNLNTGAGKPAETKPYGRRSSRYSVTTVLPTNIHTRFSPGRRRHRRRPAGSREKDG